jgi:hypothetical protein
MMIRSWLSDLNPAAPRDADQQTPELWDYSAEIIAAPNFLVTSEYWIARFRGR